MMNYNDFKKELVKDIKDEMALLYPNMELQQHIVIKNNNVRLDGLLFMRQSLFAPTVYVNYLYESFKDGTSMTSLIANVLEQISKIPSQPNNSALPIDWESAKNNVILQAVSAQHNPKRMLEIPFRRELDMLLTYRILIYIDNDSTASYQIDNELLKRFNVSEAELYQVALKNTPKLLPLTLEGIDTVLECLSTNATTTPISLDETLKQMKKDLVMYVMTNLRKLWGASAIFYPDALEKISNALNCHLFILPSSIHETILIPARGREHKISDLKLMVTEINEEFVSTEDILTNQVYLYDKNSKMLMIAEKWIV